MEMPEGTYRELVAANRIDALLLGVEGHDIQANARRAAVASEVVAEAGHREEAAYAKAHWTNEPNIAKPFAAHLIAAANGDVDEVVNGPGFEHVVREHMGITYGHEYIDDEDGARYVPVVPDSDELEAAQAEVERIRTVVSDRVSRAMEPPRVSHTAERDGANLSVKAAERVGGPKDGRKIMAGRPKLGKQSVTGNLVADPVRRETNAGVLTTMRIAENQRTYDREAAEWKDGDSVFYDVAVKNARLGENVTGSVGRGDRVSVSGNYEAVPFVSKEGEAGLSHRIWADEVSASLDYATVAVQPNPKAATPDWDAIQAEPVSVETTQSEHEVGMSR
ncbi:single-stranded DNA-binding protein [Arthrobacter pigmenti]